MVERALEERDWERDWSDRMGRELPSTGDSGYVRATETVVVDQEPFPSFLPP